MNDNIYDLDRPTEEAQTFLERKLITEYLSDKGYKMADLENLPEEQAKQLMREAANYAGLKLAEIESRSKFRKKIQGPE